MEIIALYLPRILNGGYAMNKWLVNPVADFTYSRFLSGRGKLALMTPNLLSLSRILLAILVWYFPQNAQRIHVSIIIVAGITDLLDGKLAQKLGPTPFGAFLDPTCDKILAGSYLFRFWGKIGAATCIAILAAELFILVAPSVVMKIKQLKTEDVDFRSNIYGKTKFFLECSAFVGLGLIGPKFASTLLWFAVIFAIMSIQRKIKDSLEAVKSKAV